MKNLRINLTTLTAAFAMVALLSFDAAAQSPGRGNGRGNGQGYGPGAGQGNGRGDCTANIPGLTKDQDAQVLKLRADHFRKAELTRAEIGEKQARMNTLRLAENPDAKAIDKTIDEIAALRGNLMKERETHRRDVKALLTDDQKVWFDANNRQGRGQGVGKGQQRGQRGNGQGRGWRDCPYNQN